MQRLLIKIKKGIMRRVYLSNSLYGLLFYPIGSKDLTIETITHLLDEKMLLE